MSKKIDVIDLEDQNDLFEETYEVLNKRLDIIDQLNRKTKELELLKVEYQKLIDNNKLIDTKEKEKKEEIINLSNEIKNMKLENVELKKKILMLKTLLKIIFKEYGMKNILKTTDLTLEQIKKYLN